MKWPNKFRERKAVYKGMTILNKILHQVLRDHPLALSLVAQGVKPSVHLLINFPQAVTSGEFQYHEVPTWPKLGVYYFADYAQREGVVHVLLFHEGAVAKKISRLNKIQQHFQFTSPQEVRETNISFYKLLGKKKGWDTATQQAVTEVCGVTFGYPAAAVKEFSTEVAAREMKPQRKIYKLNEDIMFVGYPGSHKVCLNLLTKWQDFKRHKYQVVIQRLKNKLLK